MGIACRFPGATGPEEFWRLLSDGRDAITGLPERLAGHALGELPGEDVPRRGGFLEEVDGFDAAFFGVTPREAVAMDPQQRLTLELSWEALEQARLVPGELRGTRTGVFFGAMADDYAVLVRSGGHEAITGHAVTGLERGVIANRISYVLGLHGPSMVIDSAQSSALVAVHLACESLRRNESDLALAGGVNLNLLPDSTLALARFGSLSPDGRCHAFDHRANGYVRGEGGGVVVLKRLRDAVRDGDVIHCVVRGGAVGSDGSTDTLPTPGREGQELVLRAAYHAARTPAEQVQYVELHGTGTRAGDPVEAAALGGVLGSPRAADDPLTVGSVKTNIGHLEGAAGIAGFIKAVLCIKHRVLVPSLNFSAPPPSIPLGELRLRVGTETAPWPHPGQPLVAGVSSFGIGGTNCHLVLADWAPGGAGGVATGTASPGGESPAEPAEETVPWVLSARSAPALRAQAGRLASRLRGNAGPGAASVGRSLAVTRSVFEHRAVLLGADDDERLAGLTAIAQGAPSHLVVQGYHQGEAVRPVFVFPGQGSQWPLMCAELLNSEPEFAAGIDECTRALGAHVPWRADAVLRGMPGAPSLDRDDVVQPVLWAVMVSLARLWRAAGVEPAAVIGHSQGEIAAATVAGALTIEDSARIVALRGVALARIAGRGGLLSIALPVDELRTVLESGDSGLTVAAINGPSQTVLAGPPAALGALAARYPGVRSGRVPIGYASHSPYMEQLRTELLEAFTGVEPRAGTVPVFSTVTGGELAGGEMDAGYWYRNLRAPVSFQAAVESALRAGHRVFVEVGPHPVLTVGVEDTMAARGSAGRALGTLRRGEGGRPRFIRALAEAFAAGAAVDWTTVFPGSVPLTDLPSYAFDRQSYWVGDIQGAGARVLRGVGGAALAPPGTVEMGGTVKAAERDVTAESVYELVRGHVAAVGGFADAAQLDQDRTFKDTGFDSAMMTDLRGRLAAATGLPLTTALLFDYPSPAALAGELAARLAGGAERTGPGEHGQARGEAIAIVGMACRFPGDVSSPQDLWKLVESGTDAISDFPDDRGWDMAALFGTDPDQPGTSLVRSGGFLREATGFDAGFFGISPREAIAMDPQQRLVLEVAWEAVESAGLVPAALRGTPAGVFVGAMATDYGPRLYQAAGQVAGFALTGSSPSVISGRVAYVLGIHGPAVTVDTACSSSLVAIHQAVRALRSGECSMALAGGVTVMATPGMFVEFSRQRGLAPDGRCKAFSAAADGTGWAEGAGMLVLKRLDDALREGDRVLAVIRGSAVNSDGASNGLTAPSGLAQQRVIRAALADAGLGAWQVDAVEAHGTGTSLGDPIEANALIATYGQERAGGQALWLGSLKSNIGHAQAAAGVGGVIKMVMAMQHGLLPGTLNVNERSPEVDWDAGGVELLAQAVEWPPASAPRRAAVSAFGISGTNAHVILEEGPAVGHAVGPAADTFQPPVVPIPLAAASPAALRAQARQLAGLPSMRETGLWPVSRSLAMTRSALSHRAVVIAAGHDAAGAGLAALAAGRETPHAVTGTVGPLGKTVFVFPGQGSQWQGMATALASASPAFAAGIAECGDALAPYAGWSLRAVLAGEAGAPSLDRVDVVQPALWAVMVALAGLWRSLGVAPDAVLGHSQGEIAAACVAGALSLDDAARTVALRSRALAVIAGSGAMAMVPLSASKVAAHLAGDADLVSIAATNGPETTVISGTADAVTRIVEAYRAGSVEARLIPVNYASHSAYVEPIRDRVLADLASLSPRAGEVRFYSTATGTWQDGQQLDAGYWYTSLRQPVRFTEAVRGLAEAGHTTFVEVSAHPVLTQAISETLEHAGRPALVTGSLRRDDGGLDRFLASAAALHVRGVPVKWERLSDDRSRPVELPTYPFQRERYWLAPAGRPRDSGLGQGAGEHPILTAAVELAAAGGVVYTGRVSVRTHPWLADHAVGGSLLVPGTALLDLARHAGTRAGCPRTEELTIASPLEVPPDGAVDLQLALGAPDVGGRRDLRIYARPYGSSEGRLGAVSPRGNAARPDGDGTWRLHAEGTVAPAEGKPGGTEEAGDWPPASTTHVPLDDMYRELAGHGYEYGPAFQGLRAAWWEGDTLYAQAELPQSANDDGMPFEIHPALIDACLHPVIARELSTSGRKLLPFAWQGISVTPGKGTRALRARLRPARDHAMEGYALEVTDAAGAALMTVDCLVLRPAESALTGSDPLLRMTWRPCRVMPTRAAGSVAILGPVAGGPLAALSGDERFAGLPELLESVNAGSAVPDLVVACCPAGRPGADRAAAATTAVQEVMALAAGWLADERTAAAKLVIVTRGAMRASDGDAVTALDHAAVWGAVRTAETENPGRFILLDADGPEVGRAELLAALACGQPQLALREGEFAVPRLTADAPDAMAQPAGASAWKLDIAERGAIDQLVLAASDGDAAAAPLAPGQVRVAVRAAGLNFRDVLNALGMYPGDPGALGLEGAGVVTQAGHAVTGFSTGDRVMGLFPGAFGPVAVADQRTLVRIPDGWTFRDAAAVPVAFLSAYYGLVELGGLRAGESVLIHAAAGGVGMAAVQIARSLGAEVYVTASPAKWPQLRQLGIDADHIASSRTGDFAGQFRATTPGLAIDVVLNSLAGELIDRSVELLAPGGRFVELGKTDLRDPGEIATLRPGARYLPFDLLEQPAELLGRLLGTVVSLLAEGTLRPLPVTVHDVRRAREAFRGMSQGQHTGKVVLTIPSPLDPEGTVLITGGTGAIARVTARHLADVYGVRHLLLASRHGDAAPGARELAAELGAIGAEVTFAAADVAHRDQVAALLSSVEARHPLTAVFHTAGVLNDGVVGSMTAGQIATVMGAKAAGAWHLHALTADLPLAAFVMFSSVMGTIGGAGQSNYAAANSFLDALAEYRVQAGLPAKSLAWGLWDDPAGMAGALTAADQGRLARAGLAAFPPAAGMAMLDAALAAWPPVLFPVRLDRAALSRLGSELPVVLSELASASARPRPAQGTGGGHGDDLRGELAGRPAAERHRILTAFLRSQMAFVLGHAEPGAILLSRPFKELGFDSLTSVELRNRLNAATGLRLPSTIVFTTPTPADLTALLAAELSVGETGSALRDRPSSAPASSAPAPARPTAAREDVSARVNEASVDELLNFIDKEFSDGGRS